ncbi:MAG: transglutaminase-like domain-containing protein [Terriglobales bacterium]
MERRNFLKSAAFLGAGLALSRSAYLSAEPTPSAGPWRMFDVTTEVEVLRPAGVTQVWLPAALVQDTPYQQTHSNTFHAEGGAARIVKIEQQALGIVAATFPMGVRPVLTLNSRVSLKDYAVDLDVREPTARPRAELEYCLRPSKLVPTDGIVKSTADKITRGAHSDRDKARAIYEWIVDNTFRDPRVLGCGRGDIRFMLESGDMGGKCADLNALYVGLARAAGLPARDVYGVRVAKSELGYKSLGAASANITKAQHCRAEVYLKDHGWVPVDPADVRKVVLEEPPGNLPLNDDVVSQARTRLFGSWEMNWMAYNFAHDVALPGSSGPTIPFLMYPQAETGEGRLNSLDPNDFRYEITTTEFHS